MKCSSCDFENMPGLERCARCNAILNLKQIDIEPPRATGPVALRRTRLGVIRSTHRIGFNFSGIIQRLRLPRISGGAPLGSLVMSLVPGLGQLVLGQRILGWSILAGWCVLMALSFLTYGSVAGSWWRALAILVHATAIALAIRPGMTRLSWRGRLMVGVWFVIVLNLTIYLALSWTTTGLCGALQINNVADTGIVQNGDTIVYTGRWLRPDRYERGDLVIYELEHGYGVDRIVALEGESVSIVSGRILVNGQPLPAEAMPLNGVRHFPDLEFTVNQGHYLILPSNLNWEAHGGNVGQLIRQMLHRDCQVNASDISGLALWRLRPFSRFGAVE